MRVLAIFGAEAVLFLMATLNIRACAKGHLRSTLATDAVIAGLNFFLIQRIADAGTLTEQAAYIAGAVVGSAVGMWFTKHWTEAR